MSVDLATPNMHRSRLGRGLECGLRGFLGFGLGGVLVALGGLLPRMGGIVSVVPAMALAGYLGGSVLAAFARSRRWTIAGGVGFATVFGLIAQGVALSITMFRPGDDAGPWAAVWGVGLAVAAFFGGIVIGRPFLARDAGMMWLLGPGLLGALSFGPFALLAGGSGFEGIGDDLALPYRLLGLALALGGGLFGSLLGLVSAPTAGLPPPKSPIAMASP